MKKVLFALLTICFAVSFAACKEETKVVDPAQLFAFAFSGVDEEGEWNYQLNTDVINELVDQEAARTYAQKVNKEYVKNAEYWASKIDLSDIIALEWDFKDDNLSNGDILTFKLSLVKDLLDAGGTVEGLEKALGIRFSTKTFSVSVEGLKVLKKIDLSSYLANLVVLTGISGDATLSWNVAAIDGLTVDGFAFSKANISYAPERIIVTHNGENLGAIYLRVGQYNADGELKTVLTDGQVKNGEKYYLFVDDIDLNRQLADMGYKIEESVVPFAVSGLPEYYSPTDVFPEDLRKANEESAKNKVEQTIANFSADETLLAGPELLGTYFMNAKDVDEPYEDWFNGIEFVNCIGVVYQYRERLLSFTERTYCELHLYPNYRVAADGTISYDNADEEKIIIAADTAEEMEEWMAEEFLMMNITKLP